MGKVIYPRKGEVHTAPVTTLPNFADNTWEQIIAACETNTVPDAWEVGDQKAMDINGTDYLIDIIGKNHDAYAAGGIAPLTFQMHDYYYDSMYNMHSAASNSVGWTGCRMRTYNLPQVLAFMPSEVQAGIKEVNKLTSAGGSSTSINTTADKLFLLSEVEVFGSVTYSVSGEGIQYTYYAIGNSPDKVGGGSLWLRSPTATGSNFCRVYDGKPSTLAANSSTRISIAFCF